MASLEVLGLCAYPSWDAELTPFRKIDWTSRYLVKAVKGDEDVLRRSFVVLGKPPRKFNHENYGELVTAFHRWGAQTAKEAGIVKPVFVAVPNSHATPGIETYGTKGLAEGMAVAFGAEATAFIGLRFREALPKSHRGGGRDKRELLSKMVLTEPMPEGEPILVDDVCSSGAHLFAAQRLLGADRVKIAIVCGRTVNEPRDKMLNIPAETITTYW